MSVTQIFTIGFTKKSAEKFFTELRCASVKHLIDVRLNNTSQLAGFAKKEDLAYFLKTICGINYVYVPELAPTANILDAYKKQKGDWAVYERHFLDLIAKRRVEETVPKNLFDRGCLLCSEDKPHHCHRRLVAEYLRDKWGNIEVKHLE
ncbi:MAG: DUF488 domain-containing protein [Herpetosiphonaceae bacterium]|nr:DUF488 domain-containing protein [Herpetosiphonaceae bacterium]